MSKIIVLSMMTLDGVIQAPGGQEEDTSGGFRYGGWTAPYDDDIFRKVIQEELQPATYLLGRKTYELWAGYWPQHGHFWPAINEGMKYVFSGNLQQTDPMVAGWKNSVVISSVADIEKLKQSETGDIHVWGSSELIQLLLEHDLVDEFRLKIYPLTLGQGKKLFGTGTIPAAFTLINSVITTKGVVILHYKRDGSVQTGTVGV